MGIQFLQALWRLRFLYVTAASTRDLVSPGRWVVDETWETWNDAYRVTGACTIAAVCAGALYFGLLAPRTVMLIQNDVEVSQAGPRLQAIEAPMETIHITRPPQNSSSTTHWAKVRQFGLSTRGKISKMHLRHYVALAWSLSIAISLLSAMTAIGPLLWSTRTRVHHEKDHHPSHWRMFTSLASKFAWNYFAKTACSFMDLDQAVTMVAGMMVFTFSTYDAGRAYYVKHYSEGVQEREDPG